MKRWIALGLLGILLLGALAEAGYLWLQLGASQAGYAEVQRTLEGVTEQSQASQQAGAAEIATLQETVAGATSQVAEAKRAQSVAEKRYADVQHQFDQLQVPVGTGFQFYYTGLNPRRTGVEDLRSYLRAYRWAEDVYRESVFDCSEMTAYFEWKLENEGWHTRIAVGDSPSGSGVGHAWLMVEVAPGLWVPVEATAPAVVEQTNKNYIAYYQYDTQYEDINYALANSKLGEFEWWESLATRRQVLAGK